jgi:hypothetical protein
VPRTANPSGSGSQQPLAPSAEVAWFLGIPEKTLAEWRSRGLGPDYLKIGRYVRYRWSAVNAWLDTRGAGLGRPEMTRDAMLAGAAMAPRDRGGTVTKLTEGGRRVAAQHE